MIDVLLKNNIANPEVACLPSGSGSDFMRTFAFPKTINEGVERLKTNQDYKIDVAYIKSENKSRHFVNVLNFGFLADTVKLARHSQEFLKDLDIQLVFGLNCFLQRVTYLK